MNEQIEQIKNLILRKYDPKECGYTSERSMGNYDDVFEDGYACGESSTLYEIGIILGMDLKEPEEQEYDF